MLFGHLRDEDAHIEETKVDQFLRDGRAIPQIHSGWLLRLAAGIPIPLSLSTNCAGQVWISCWLKHRHSELILI